MATQDEIGNALGKIPSGVGVLTAKHQNEESAMLASWFQQAAFEPPLITVAVNKSRPIGPIIDSSKKFCLSLFHTNQKELFSHFAKGFKPGEDPFEDISVMRKTTACPIITEAMSFLECELVSVTEAGDHLLYLGRIVDAGVLDDGKSMVHTRSNGFRY